MRILMLLVLFASTLLTSCKKEEQPLPAPSEPLTFVSLTAGATELRAGTITTLTATATGSNLQYSWSASAGSIIGSGSQVEFGACCLGNCIIECTVSDGVSSVKKTIDIIVTE